MAARGKARPPARTTDRGGSSSRRDELLLTAAETFADMGYSQATVRDIAQRAGILNGSLYYHFDSKEAMVEELLHRYFDQLSQRYDALPVTTDHPDDGLVALIHDTLALASEQIRVVQILQKDWHYLSAQFAFVRDGLRKAEDKWVAVIQGGIDAGTFRPELDAHVVYRSIRSSIFDAAVTDGAKRTHDVDKLAAMQVMLFLDGMRRPS